ncbi:putative bifunctional diguanylate cyclase/phosphodiesterase [Pseudomarimonas arenosa]|uniref:EAL domain-containing protein n=1 Tax=Pseudomarimonas arenosa TaxID=2774145 RepID=A0AAW3ZKH8_9GAMM|nr:bifunctional diguanylate cyclase/phosphodiesterase [Pseudomarimonas arenosa]MBD8525687.1 EAL domain-containing protein [Pseudomarimonas arenosa]
MGRLRIRIFLFVFALSVALLVVSQQLAWRQADEQAAQLQVQQLQHRGRWLVETLRFRIENQVGPQLWLPWLAEHGVNHDTLHHLLRSGAFSRIEQLTPEPLAVGDSEAPDLAALEPHVTTGQWFAIWQAQQLWLVQDHLLTAGSEPRRLRFLRRIDLGVESAAGEPLSALWIRQDQQWRPLWSQHEDLSADSIRRQLQQIGGAESLSEPVLTGSARFAFTPFQLLHHELVWVQQSWISSDAMAASLREWQMLALGLLAFLLSVGGALWLDRSISRPMAALARYMRRVGAGEERVAPPSLPVRGELAAVAREFAFMLSTLAKREESIRHLAFHDSLTGLANRHRFAALLAERLGDAQISRLCVVVIDLARFREINDTLGHGAGDNILKQVAARLLGVAALRQQVARLSADEFGVLIINVHPAELMQGLSQIAAIFDVPFQVDKVSLEVRASLGAAVYPEHGDSPGMLLQRSEIALFQAKQQKQRIVVYSPEQDGHTLRRLTLMAELRAAIDRDELSLYVQPKLDIAGWRIVGVECLVRWHHPQYGMVPPDEFIPLAEQTGAIRQLTNWMLRKGLDWAKRWRDDGLQLKVAINVSTVDLLDPLLAKRVSGWIRERGLPADALLLEVTESAVMQDAEGALPMLRELRDFGVDLAVDDFGTGYSSMLQLKRLPVGELKIDKSFVMGVLRSADDAVIVRSTIDLAHNLDLVVVAEGVEDDTTLEWLKRFGCDLAQGYLLSKPMPADLLSLWLDQAPYLCAGREHVGLGHGPVEL